MSDQTHIVKPPNLASLKNVAGFMELVLKLQQRGPHLPNLGVMYGHSGLGKTYAATYAQNKTDAIRVEIGDSWNRKTFVRAILRELGLSDPRGTTPDMVEQAIGLLAEEPMRPLLIDEADKLVDKGLIETVRELSEGTRIPVLLIGEEKLPQKLQRVERVHNRVLAWYGAELCDLDDCKKLAAIFLSNTKMDLALLDTVRIQSDGRARRIVVNLSNMNEWARNNGITELTRASYTAPFYSGVAPLRPRRLSLAGGAAA